MRSEKVITVLVVSLVLMAWSVPIVQGSQYLTVNGQDVTSITLELGQSCTVEIVSIDSTSYVDYAGFDNGLVLGTFSYLETRPEAGNLAAAIEYDQPTFYGYYVNATGISPPPSAGVHFIFEYTAQQTGETDLTLYDSTFTSIIDSLHITVIPLQPVPMGTAWTYQGRLIDSENPADGLYDFKFKLYDNPDPVYAAQQGSAVDINDVDVIDGYFVVNLDFGSDVFDGDARWLEIIVRPGGSSEPNDFVTLSSRQEVTPTPNAIYASKAPWSGLTGIPAGFADGVDNDTTYSAGNQLKMMIGNVFNVLEGAGSDLDADLLDGQEGSFYRNAANINSGILNNARFSAYSDLSSDGYLDNNAGNDLLTRTQADDRYVNEYQSDSITSMMILNAAQGAAGTSNIYGSTTNNTVTEMDSFTVNVPGPGMLTIFVMGHVYLNCDSTSSSSRLCYGANIGICDTPDSSASCGTSYSQSRLDFEDPDNVSSINEEKWIVIARTVNVSSAGNRTFYLNGRSTESGMTFQITGYVVAIFNPNSMTVSNP